MAEKTTTAEIADADLEALREQLHGDALVRGDSAWDAARQAWNLLARQEPALVVMAESADDVAATVRFARAHGLRVAPQGTGHGAATIAGLGDAILLRTSRDDRRDGRRGDPHRHRRGGGEMG